MKALDRKLLRDLRLMWSQALTIALVVASGVAGFVGTFSAYQALSSSRDLYYAEARFADVFASLKRAPQSLERQLQKTPGVAQVDTTLHQLVPIDLPGVSDPIIGELIGLSPRTEQRLNAVHLRRGRMVERRGSGAIETMVSEAFATERGLTPGSRLHALVNGKREELVVVGIALSPEYVFAGLAGSPDQRGFGIFWVDRDTLAAAYNMDGAFNHVALRLAPGGSQGAVIDSLNRQLAPYGTVRAYGREDQLSDRILSSEISQQRVLGTVLPSIFLGVAGFLLHVVLSRQITTQREQIAALKALGYPDLQIALHYLKLTLVIVVAGLLLGLALGAGIGKWFSGLYADVFRFPTLHYQLSPGLVLTAASVTLAAGLLATLNAIRATVALAPAEAMRPPAPGIYRPMLVERLGLQKWFPAALRMVLRTMERRPLRTLLTVLGIALAMAIVVTGAFWRDATRELLDTQFQRVMRADVAVALMEATPARVEHEFLALPHVTAVESSRQVSVRLVNGHLSYHGAIQGRPAQPALQRIVDIEHQVHLPPPQGLLLTDRLAERLGVGVGDLLRVEVMEGRRRVLMLPVSGTVKEMMGMNVYIERRALNRLLQEGDMVSQVSVAVERGHETELLVALKALPRVLLAVSKLVMVSNIEDVTARNVLVFSAILTTFATIIAIGVVYNSARIALSERAWELASLRVLGFTRAEVSGLLLGELAIEIALAIPLGMVLGYGLSLMIVKLITNDEFYFPLVIQAHTYAFAALCVVGAGLVSALIVRRRIDTLDLVGVLKTRE
ncbi:MAG: FtsX-like permease family protein [Cytophagales bacterium]|nr:FtsX-like permease family protein [Rhizobacter sp.]